MIIDKNTTIAKILEMVKEYSKDIDSTNLWYDWFCKDSSLQNRGKALLSRLSSIVKANAKNETPKFDPEKCRVVFKNCCPLYGNLYDAMSIIDIDTNETVFYVVPKIGHYSDDYGMSNLWSELEDFDVDLTCEWKDVINYFKGV